MSYDNNNKGALFKNRKEKDTHPDYRGKCEVNGKKMEIAAWIKKSQNGTKYMSLNFQEPREKEKKYAGDDDTAPRKPQDRGRVQDLDDDIPF